MSVHFENGTWYVRFQVNGHRVRKAIKEARTKTQAERAEQVLRNEIFERKWGETGRRVFSDFVEKSYKPYAEQHKKGYDVERSVLAALDHAFGKLRLAEITPLRVLDFQRQRATEITNRGRQRSIATVNRDMAVLSAIMKLALKLGEIRENPVAKISYFGNLPKRDRVLSDDEEIRLLEGVKADTDLREMIETLLYTGLRRGELQQLQWRDINFDLGVISIRADTTKTGKARTVPMLSNVRRILESRLAAEAEYARAAPTATIFRNGGTLSGRLKSACGRLGIQGVSAHTLRHTFSTRANQFGVDPFAQKAALGHSRLSQTADYTHQSIETFRGNFEGFESHIARRNNAKV